MTTTLNGNMLKRLIRDELKKRQPKAHLTRWNLVYHERGPLAVSAEAFYRFDDVPDEHVLSGLAIFAR